MKTPERLDAAEEDGLKTLRLFLRSFLPKLSAIAGKIITGIKGIKWEWREYQRE